MFFWLFFPLSFHFLLANVGRRRKSVKAVQEVPFAALQEKEEFECQQAQGWDAWLLDNLFTAEQLLLGGAWDNSNTALEAEAISEQK